MVQALLIYRDKIINPPGVGGGPGTTTPALLIDHTFADRAARDAFYTTDGNAADNLAALVQGETVILILDNGSGESVVEIWTGASAPASYVNTNWADITVTLPTAATVKILYESNADTNALVDAKLAVLDVLSILNNQLVSSLPFVTTPTSLIFGVNGPELASAGDTMVFESTTNQDSFVILNEFDPTTGSASLRRSRLIPRDTYNVQPMKTENSALNPTFTYTVAALGPSQSPALAAEDRRHTDALTIETADTGTITATLRDTDANGRLLRVQTAAVTADTEVVVSLDKALCLAVGTVVHVTISGDVRLKGVTSGPDFNPFLRVRSYLGYDDAIVTRHSANSFAMDFKNALETLTGTNRLARSAIYQEIVEIDDAAVTANTYTISSDDNGKLLMNTRALGTTTDIAIPAGIQSTVSFFDVFAASLGTVRVTGVSGSGVTINEESDITFTEHEGARVTKTTVTDEWGLLFNSMATSATLTIQDEGTALTTDANTLNFTGDGVTATGTGTTKTINIPGGGGGLAGITIEDEGGALTTLADTLNFVGAGVSATGTGSEKTINVPGGGVGTLFSSISTFSTQTGAHTINSLTNTLYQTGTQITSLDIDDSPITENLAFAIHNEFTTDFAVTVSGSGVSFQGLGSGTSYTIPAGQIVLFFAKFNQIYPIVNFSTGGAAGTDHPVILTRDTPSLTDLAALADASLNDNSALWVVASNQVAANESGVDATIMVRALAGGIPDANGDDLSTTAVQKSGVVLAAGSIVRIFSSTDLRVVSAPGIMPAAERFPDIPFSGSLEIEENQGLYNSYLRRTATNAGGVTNEYIRMPDLHPSSRPSWVVPGDVFAMRHTGTATGSQRPAFRVDNTGDQIAGHGFIYFADPGQTIAIQAPARGIRTWQLFPVSQLSSGDGSFYDPEMMVEGDWYTDDAGAIAVNNSARLHYNQEMVDGVVRDHIKTSAATNNPIALRFQSRDIQDDIAWIEWFSAMGAAVPALGATVEEIKENVPTSLAWIESNLADNWDFDTVDPDVIHSISYVTYISGDTVKVGITPALSSHVGVLDVINIASNSFAGNNGDWAITTVYSDRLAVNITIPGASSSHNTGASGSVSRPLYCRSALIADDIRQHNFNIYRNSARNNPITTFYADWFDITSETPPTGCILQIGYNTDIETTGSQLAVQDEAGDFFTVKGGPRAAVAYVDNKTTPVTSGTALPVSSPVINIDTDVENLFYLPEFPDELPAGEVRRYDIVSAPDNDIGHVKVAIGDSAATNQIAFNEGPKELTSIPGDSIGVELYNDGMTPGARLFKHIHRRIESNVVYPTIIDLPSLSFLLPFTSGNLNSAVNEDPHGHIFDLSTANRVTVKAKGRYTFNTSLRVWFKGNEPSGLQYATPLLTPYTTGNQPLYPYTFSMPLILSRNGASSGNGAYVTLMAVFDFLLDVDDWMEFEIQTAYPTGFSLSDFGIQNFTFSVTADIGG